MATRCHLIFQQQPTDGSYSFFPEIAKFVAKVGQDRESGNVLPGCAVLFVLSLTSPFAIIFFLVSPNIPPSQRYVLGVCGLLCVAQQHHLCESVHSDLAVAPDDVSEACSSCAGTLGPGTDPSQGFGEASQVLGGCAAELFPRHFCRQSLCSLTSPICQWGTSELLGTLAFLSLLCATTRRGKPAQQLRRGP